MKKRVYLYLIVLISMFSLQSCVTNYVVSQPNVYKVDANLVAIVPQKVVNNRSDKSDQLKASFELLKSAETNEIVASAISHTKKIDEILNEASTYLGTPYRFGGMTRNGIDCSAFVLSVFGAATGMNLPRVAAEQAQQGESIDKTQLEKGDLVFFSHGGKISHVGIVQEVTADGEIKFIHAATSRGVMISSLNDSYWGPKYRFAKRIIR